MITSILLSFIMLAAQPATGPSAGAGKSISHADALAAIDRFLADPKAGDDQRTIMRFAEESEDCMVGLDANILTWMNHDPPYAQQDLLNTAFVAGNVRAQLQSKKVADDPYSGLLAVFKVYD